MSLDEALSEWLEIPNVENIKTINQNINASSSSSLLECSDKIFLHKFVLDVRRRHSIFGAPANQTIFN